MISNYWRPKMFKKSLNLNWLLSVGATTACERILIKERLLNKGYMMSDIKELPPQVAKNLAGEACLFAARTKLVRIGLL
jgi:hypothetical protein